MTLKVKDAAKARLMEGIGEGINTIASPNDDQSGSGFQRKTSSQEEEEICCSSSQTT
jgi:hypothetical protein